MTIRIHFRLHICRSADWFCWAELGLTGSLTHLWSVEIWLDSFADFGWTFGPLSWASAWATGLIWLYSNCLILEQGNWTCSDGERLCKAYWSPSSELACWPPITFHWPKAATRPTWGDVKARCKGLARGRDEELGPFLQGTHDSCETMILLLLWRKWSQKIPGGKSGKWAKKGRKSNQDVLSNWLLRASDM